MTDVGIAIVGSGQAGAQCAIALRERGCKESITIVSDDADLPYERPPLSKDFLAGERSFDRLLLRRADFWTARDVRFLQPVRVVGIDPHAHTLRLDSGPALAYRKLVWAAGGTPRSLACPGHDLRGIHHIRSRAQVDRIRTELADARRVAIIGAGYVGLEAAAVLARLGKAVTVLEAQPRVLSRVTGPVVSAFLAERHRAHGVDIRTGVAVAALRGEGGRVAGVTLSTGEVVDADMVIVGIGIAPNVEPLLAAGAKGGNGVLVDDHCRTSLEDVYAIGDCALQHSAFADGAAVRLESVQNAADQALAVARDIAGEAVAPAAVPWFWSSQYDIKLQTVGLCAGHDSCVTHGDPGSGSFAVIYLRRNRVVAVDCINATRSFVAARNWIGKPLDPQIAAAVPEHAISPAL